MSGSLERDDASLTAPGGDQDAKREESSVLHWLMNRLVEREQKHAPSLTQAMEMREAVGATVAELTKVLEDMPGLSCTQAQMRFAHQHAIRVLLVGRLAAVQQFTRTLASWLSCVRIWPESANAPDPRAGTPLEGVNTLYCSVEGQMLRLQYASPLALPEIGDQGYCCAVCRRQTLVTSFQSVDIDGDRDKGSYQQGRAGFDVCVGCARDMTSRAPRRVMKRLRKCGYERSLPVVGPASVGRLGFRGVRFSESLEEVVVRCYGTPGMWVFAAVVPSASAEMLAAPPAGWARSAAGVSRLAPSYDGEPSGSACFAELTSKTLEGVQCTVCAEPLLAECSIKGPPVTTPCGHSFHTTCIRTVCRGVDGDSGSQECPNCRSDLRSKPLQCTPIVSSETIVLTEDALGRPIEDRAYEVLLLLCQHPDEPVMSASLVSTALLAKNRPSFFGS